ncbi:head closure Hc1 (endogenous virus) [Clostridium phage phiCTC2B]|uniref:Head-tail adaptor protein n=1 Tax=Clostridium tetani (strain Massachusetts / E88) TaxID=212717 RepID=Q892H1_CLOTE|nr:phage head closure protein [Clostridium tetani]YP_009217931.1 head closure Hc1 [Clostridium phage phiCT453B]YP_009276935.1 head closure Hc1 [Clostridium phage phiCT19406B]YP_009277379.1 head closure Hc1 [Clostridium phage phiCTC2B]AAO36624.1 hypothetical protein CTC_02128 [Clostridium tetani E88]AJA42587.1 head-tail adaptor protein [Clostridium phage phiCT453B]AJA42795.1 head-tail adaptor protein [Clostridium phage phiCT19406B]AJA42991.1 head-tail adaptor protein [Clostridium phage phiCTC
MDAGALNKRVSIMEYKDVENEVGDIELKLVPTKKVWAFITSLDKGGEYLENKKLQQRLIYKIIIRYIKDIDQSMFVKYKDTIFNIKDILGKDMNGQYLTLFAEEKVSENETYEGEENEW